MFDSYCFTQTTSHKDYIPVLRHFQKNSCIVVYPLVKPSNRIVYGSAYTLGSLGSCNTVLFPACVNLLQLFYKFSQNSWSLFVKDVPPSCTCINGKHLPSNRFQEIHEEDMLSFQGSHDQFMFSWVSARNLQKLLSNLKNPCTNECQPSLSSLDMGITSPSCDRSVPSIQKSASFPLVVGTFSSSLEGSFPPQILQGPVIKASQLPCHIKPGFGVLDGMISPSIDAENAANPNHHATEGNMCDQQEEGVVPHAPCINEGPNLLEVETESNAEEEHTCSNKEEPSETPIPLTKFLNDEFYFQVGCTLVSASMLSRQEDLELCRESTVVKENHGLLTVSTEEYPRTALMVSPLLPVCDVVLTVPKLEVNSVTVIIKTPKEKCINTTSAILERLLSWVDSPMTLPQEQQNVVLLELRNWPGLISRISIMAASKSATSNKEKADVTLVSVPHAQGMILYSDKFLQTVIKVAFSACPHEGLQSQASHGEFVFAMCINIQLLTNSPPRSFQDSDRPCALAHLTC